MDTFWTIGFLAFVNSVTAAKLAAPRDVRAVKATVYGTTAYVSWAAPDYDIRGYKVYYIWEMLEDTLNKVNWPHVELTGTFTSIHIEALEPHWKYAILVKAIAKNGTDSNFSYLVHTENYVGPYKVRKFEAKQKDKSTVIVSWIEPRAQIAVSNYVLSYRGSGTRTEEIFLPASQRSFEIPKLSTHKQYTFFVKARFDNGIKGRNSQISITLV